MPNKLYFDLKEKYKDKNILIVGLGLQGGGTGLARFFAQLGAHVKVTDKKNELQLAPSIKALQDYKIEYRLGTHNTEDFLKADLIFKGPGVLWNSPEILAALKNRIPVEMEMSYVAANFPGTLIGVTGTRGKSTTTNLIYELMKQSGLPVHLGGGLPGISNIEFLKTLSDKDYLVAELSSWALSGFHRAKISPRISVLTNIYPDHLNYYKTMQDYIFDKAAIYMYQKSSDHLVVNQSLDKLLPHPENETELTKGTIHFFTKGDFPQSLRHLRGDHNKENAAAAYKVSQILKLNGESSARIISQYAGLPFRQEKILESNRVTFINDTTSTTPIATKKALATFTDKPVYLILGGNAKNLPLDDLIDQLESVKKIILLAGSFTDEIFDELKRRYPDKLTSVFEDLGKAVNMAYSLASEDKDPSYVLFSPGATSFAMFNNEFHRGLEFNKIVKEITQNVK